MSVLSCTRRVRCPEYSIPDGADRPPCWGTGLTTGGPAEGCVGRYHARYFGESGAEKFIFELVIAKNGEIYTLSWLIDGAVRLTGIGMEVNEGLAAGFRPID